MSLKSLVPILLPADPAVALEAATKQYVDNRTQTAVLVQAALSNLAGGQANNNINTIYTSAALGSDGLLSVNLSCYLANTGTTVTDYLCVCDIMRAGSPVGGIAGHNAKVTSNYTQGFQMKINFQWADARSADTLRVNFNRVGGTNTYGIGFSGVANHGISYVVQPYS